MMDNGTWREAARIDAKRLSRCQLDDVIASLAGLQLSSRNSSSTLRLQAVVHALASVNGGGIRPVTSRLLNEVVNAGAIAGALRHLEDAPARPFTSSMAFRGGAYRFLPGLSPGVEFTARAISTALGRPRRPYAKQKFQREASRLWLSGLLISEEVCRRAALPRNLQPEFDGRSVYVPNHDALRTLKCACKLSLTEVADILGAQSIRLADISPLLLRPGDVEVASYSPEAEPLDGRALLRFEDSVVVANPSGVMSSCMRAILELARDREALGEFQQRVFSAIASELADLLAIWSINRTPILSGPVERWGLLCFEGVATIDTDKALHVVYVDLPLALGEDLGTPFDLTSYEPQLRERVDATRKELFSRYPRLNEVCSILVAQPMFRSIRYPSSLSEGHSSFDECLLAEELEVMVNVASDNTLAFRQYLEHGNRVRQQGELIAWSCLDEWAYLQARLEGQFSPGGAGDVMVQSGLELSLRMDVVRRRDRHGVVSPAGGTIEVVRRWEDEAIPVYFVPSFKAEAWGLCVESATCVTWIRPVADGDAGHVPSEIVDMFAYWIWQLSEDLAAALEDARSTGPSLVIDLRGPPLRSWASPLAPSSSDDTWLTVESNGDGSYLVQLSDAAPTQLIGLANRGERETIERTLEGIRAASNGRCDSSLSDARITDALDRKCPLGPKKMFHAVPADLFAGLRSGPTIDARGIQASEADQVEEEIAHSLERQGFASRGTRVDRERRVQALKAVVADLYDRFVSEVRRLSPEGLLEFLVAWSDALVAHDRWREVTLPYRLACFSDAGRLSREYASELSSLNQASLAMRWLIEYVVAEPPRGIRPCSFSVIDRLLALAASIASYGLEADYLHFGVADCDLVISQSGRLDIVSPLNRARSAFVSRRALGLIRRHNSAWSSATIASGTSMDPAATSDLERRLEDASRAEFGVSIGELEAVRRILLKEFSATLGSVVVQDETEVEDRVAQTLSWSRDRTRTVLGRLSLEPREAFMTVPNGDEKPYPWKYGREFAYVRRPILKRKVGSRWELVWGVSHLSRGHEFLRNVCISGKLKARSPAMRSFVGEMREEAGREFERQVASVVRDGLGLVIRTRVKRIGSKRLVDDEGQELGDVDILAADPQKRVVFAIECKDLTIGRTPAEIANEIESLYQDRPNRPCTVTKHARRIAWLNHHLPETIEFLGVRSDGNWRVLPLIVTSAELLGPEVERSEMSLVTITELEHDGLPMPRNEKRAASASS